MMSVEDFLKIYVKHQKQYIADVDRELKRKRFNPNKGKSVKEILEYEAD